ncbi:Zn-dependent hydrolase [Neorhizobium sp. NCHU2750]|uniref:Zn-dependent hydrolase n=1 Tax=Neorhizobium sp. NCHU2750 TaxID=1825976 RepID=UPI000EB72183|nr:N-carbamoyl-beta-alanine amidohydrolase [Neorhizobium sp. NCHU2750]
MESGAEALPSLSAGQIVARRILGTLEAATKTPPGITRAAYGPGEQFAHDLVRAEAEALGARAQVDAAGNLYMRLYGRNPDLPELIIGSHLDTVPHGGNYDGAAGVVAGLAVMADLVERQMAPPRTLTVMVTRAEEAAWFPLSYPGSQAAFGLMTPQELEARRSDTGMTLYDHMAQAGFDPEAVLRGEAQIHSQEIAAFIEVHIEQGPRLLAAGRPIGIVSGIAGGFRYVNARCLGAYAHSGAEPRFSRHDSVLGFCDLMQAMELEWDALQKDGREATITVGRIESDPTQHGGSRVLGELSFTLDIRSGDEAVLTALQERLEAACSEIAARRGVRFDLGPAFSWSTGNMDAELISRLDASAERLAMTVPHLPSGAGHDAAAFAAAGVSSAMLFVRNENGSHNPDESMEMADLDEAIRILGDFVMNYEKN